MKLKIAFPLAFALAASPALAGNAELQYESQFFIAGFLIRAGGACPMTDWKHTIDVGVNMIGSPELAAVLRGFPKRTKAWMEKGADTFNVGVMQDGIAAACAYALKTRAKAEARLPQMPE